MIKPAMIQWIVAQVFKGSIEQKRTDIVTKVS